MEKLFFEILNFMTFGALKKNPQNLKRDEKVVLYFFPSCPYCKPVIDAFNKKKVMVEARNIHASALFQQELASGGGQAAVPCIRIENDHGEFEWLYDSNKIISFINNRYTN